MEGDQLLIFGQSDGRQLICVWRRFCNVQRHVSVCAKRKTDATQYHPKYSFTGEGDSSSKKNSSVHSGILEQDFPVDKIRCALDVTPRGPAERKRFADRTSGHDLRPRLFRSPLHDAYLKDRSRFLLKKSAISKWHWKRTELS